MILKKTLVAGLAVAIAMAFAPLAELKAAMPAGPGIKASADTLTQTVAKKKRTTKKGKRKGKRAHSKGPGRCGANMYYSRKAHHCMDARKK
jgi:hypothetical protein